MCRAQAIHEPLKDDKIQISSIETIVDLKEAAGRMKQAIYES